MRRQVPIASSTNWTKKYKTLSLTMSFLGQDSNIYGFLLLYLFYVTMRILAPFTVLGFIRKTEQVAGNRKASEERDQMFYGVFFQ